MKKKLFSVFILLNLLSLVNIQAFISTNNTHLKNTRSFFNKIYTDTYINKHDNETSFTFNNTNITFKTYPIKIDIHFHSETGDITWIFYAINFNTKNINILSQKNNDAGYIELKDMIHININESYKLYNRLTDIITQDLSSTNKLKIPAHNTYMLKKNQKKELKHLSACRTIKKKISKGKYNIFKYFLYYLNA